MTISDAYESFAPGLTGPAVSGFDITPDDGADLPTSSRAIYVGASGDLVVTMVGGGTVTLTAVPVGILPIRVSRVHATGTTAADLVAVW